MENGACSPDRRCDSENLKILAKERENPLLLAGMNITDCQNIDRHKERLVRHDPKFDSTILLPSGVRCVRR